MEKILISACLVGDNCTYKKSNHKLDRLDELLAKYELVPFCAEVEGGLKVPRIPAEINKDKVINKNGEDVTDNYNLGASKAMLIINYLGITKAILKENSPSCGSNFIYDGTFKNKKIKGQGVLAKKLKQKGILIYNEDTYIELLKD